MTNRSGGKMSKNFRKLGSRSVRARMTIASTRSKEVAMKGNESENTPTRYVIDEDVLYNVVRAVPARGAFDISDASGNALYAPSKVKSAVKVLIRDGFVAPVNESAKLADIHRAYRLTEKGVKLQRDILTID